VGYCQGPRGSSSCREFGGLGWVEGIMKVEGDTDLSGALNERNLTRRSAPMVFSSNSPSRQRLYQLSESPHIDPVKYALRPRNNVEYILSSHDHLRNRPQDTENRASRPLSRTQAVCRYVSSWVGDHQRIRNVDCFCRFLSWTAK
jgi:hypothetical protein